MNFGILVKVFWQAGLKNSLFAFLFYILGSGLAQYLGFYVDWNVFALGLMYIIFVLIGEGLLRLRFEYDRFFGQNNTTIEEKVKSRGQVQNQVMHQILLFFAILVFTIGAIAVVLLNQRGVITIALSVYMVIFFVLSVLLVVPPVKLDVSGYGELLQSVLIVIFASAMSYQLQTGEFHRLLPMLTFPLLILYLAMVLACSLKNYAADMKAGRKILMLRVGWQRGIQIHNGLVMFSFLMIGLSTLFGLPWNLTWPLLAAMPFGLFQVWLLIKISEGAKPNWNLLHLTATASVGLSSYLLTYVLWIG